jgi:hypothetical protein
MTYKGDLDEAIDRAVRGLMSVDPPPGLRRRVLARLEQTGRPRIPVQLVRACFVGGPILALLIVMFVVWTRGNGEPQVARSQPALPAPPVSASEALALRPSAVAPAISAPGTARPTVTREPQVPSSPPRGEAVSAARQPDRVVIAPLNPLSPIQMTPVESEKIRFDAISIDPIAIDPLRVEALPQTPH